MKRLVGTEEQLCQQVAQYLRLKYPSVLFHFDYGSGVKLTMGQATKQKRLNSRAWPDLMIAHPKLMTVDVFDAALCSGLFLELKKEGVKIYKKDGSYVSDLHIQEQAAVLEQLRLSGYAADFAIGYDDCINKIDNYLKGV